MQRFCTPEELTGTLIYLVSDLSVFVTGVVIPVDGGFSAYSGI
jgi:NAD(P)-dependent dehydrogenase (short-subunit alcohol dehydrogenase family)